MASKGKGKRVVRLLPSGWHLLECKLRATNAGIRGALHHSLPLQSSPVRGPWQTSRTENMGAGCFSYFYSMLPSLSGRPGCPWTLNLRERASQAFGSMYRGSRIASHLPASILCRRLYDSLQAANAKLRAAWRDRTGLLGLSAMFSSVGTRTMCTCGGARVRSTWQWCCRRASMFSSRKWRQRACTKQLWSKAFVAPAMDCKDECETFTLE